MYYTERTLLKALVDVANDHMSYLSDSSKVPRALATNRGYMIMQRDTSPCQEGKNLARRLFFHLAFDP